MIRSVSHLACSFFIAVSALAMLGGPARSEDVGSVATRLVERVVRPGYGAFHAATEHMAGAAQALCETPSETALDAARTAFSDTARAWSRIEIVRFGPVAAENRFERVLLYPDPRGIGLRQVQSLLASGDETATRASTLADKSVAVQGLGALEFVLFGPGAEGLATGEGFRCHYAAAISDNLKGIAAELVAAWTDPDGISVAWTHPGPDNPVFHNENEMLGEILGTVVHGIEAVRDIRLNAFLGASPGEDRPRAALFRRSANTMPVLLGNLEALDAVFAESDLGGLLPDGMRSIAGSIAFEFRSALSAARGVQAPVEDALADPALRGKLDFLSLTLGSLKNRIGEDYGTAVGLSAGFSFADGD